MAKRPSVILTIANYIMIPLFLFSVALQYNDPDPVQWMMIYGFAAVACVLYLMDRLRTFLPLCIAVGSLIWAISIAPDVVGRVLPMHQVFGMMHMISEQVEETREIGGLIIVACWMLVLTVAARRSRQSNL